MFRSRISHFVRRSFTRSSFAGSWWPATSHGFATMNPRRRGSQCSSNIFSLLELGSSGQDRLRGKLWPLSFGIRMTSCLWTFWARSAGRLWPIHPTRAETEEWHPEQATEHWHQGHHHSSQLAYSYILKPRRVRNLRNWYGRWFLTRRTYEYSTDLASSDFHLFGLLKDFLRGQYFTNNGELKTTVSLSSKNVDKELYRAGFQQCARQWEKCVLVNDNWEETWILTA